MLINLKMDIVHADDTGNVVFKAARSRRVLRQLSPLKDACRDFLVVIVGEWVDAEALGDEPARPVRLLSLNNEQLHGHEQYDQHGSHLVGLLVQEVVLKRLQVQRHEALSGE